MNKFIWLLIAAFFISGCVTQKRCFEKFPPQLIVKDSIVYRDTTIYIDTTITIPGETIVLIDTLPCPITGKYRAKGKRGSVDVDIVNGVMTVKSTCDEYQHKISLMKRLGWKEYHRFQREIHELKITKKLNWWQQTIQILGYVLLGYISLRLIVFVIRKYSKLQIPFI